MTPKQEAFARAYVETGNASEAYRRAYKADRMKPESIKVNACKLLKDANVALTVQQLKAEHAERHAITVDDLVAELEEARTLAKEERQPSASVSATMGKAKLLGLIVEKNEHTGKDGTPLVPILNVTVGRD